MRPYMEKPVRNSGRRGRCGDVEQTLRLNSGPLLLLWFGSGATLVQLFIKPLELGEGFRCVEVMWGSGEAESGGFHNDLYENTVKVTNT